MHKDEGHDCGPDCTHESHNKVQLDSSNFKEDKVKVKVVPDKKANAITFENFINFFPEVELPYTITSDTQRFLSVQNDPLSATWMFNFVLDKDAVIDEFTEYMPCFSIPGTKQFFAIVYWEAGIDGSTYYLTTFSKTGVMIDKAKIAGTKYGDDGLYQMVCTISPNWLFSTVEGKLDEQGNVAAISEEDKHLYSSLQMSGDGEIVKI